MKHIDYNLHIAIEESMSEYDEQNRHASCNVNPVYSFFHK